MFKINFTINLRVECDGSRWQFSHSFYNIGNRMLTKKSKSLTKSKNVDIKLIHQ